MKTRAFIVVALAVALLSAGFVQAQEQAPWLHIRVTEEGESGAKVSVNLPISLLEVALEIAEKEGFTGRGHGHGIRVGRHEEVDLEDLRRMWSELRAAGDAEYVNVEDGDESVRIYRQGERVMIHVDEDGEEKVRVEVPFSVVDILLEGDGDELNLTGALRELANSNNGEIIQVHDGDTTVRVWIDNNSQD